LESLLNLPLAGGARVRILQITDTHLFAEKHETLLGINTWESYQAVLSAIHASQRPCDLIVATGDLAQDHSSAAYQHFAEASRVLLHPASGCRATMISSRRCTVPCRSGHFPAKRVFLGDHWQILLLDSQVFGVPHGELSDFQLEWLEQSWRRRRSAIPAPAAPSSAAGGLQLAGSAQPAQRRRAGQRVGAFPRVKHLLCGHIHQELDLDWNGRRMMATPSTCVSLNRTAPISLWIPSSPGWRWLELHPDGTLTTEVCRLEGAFHPDTASEGY
jgi:Icc protein